MIKAFPKTTKLACNSDLSRFFLTRLICASEIGFLLLVLLVIGLSFLNKWGISY
ncbi:hypothetical protein AOR13_3419 [Alteromonas stellipolaris LMG 21856]|nr:hypothetical protein AOR13_3419 [Alteromonas stellipolaris LMG 21856]